MICRKCGAITPSRLPECAECGATDDALDKHYEGSDIDDDKLRMAIKLSGFLDVHHEAENIGFCCVSIERPETLFYYFKMMTLEEIEDEAIYGDVIVFNVEIGLAETAPNRLGELLKSLSDINLYDLYARCSSTNEATTVDVRSYFHVPSMFSFRDLIYFVENCMAGTAIAVETLAPLLDLESFSP